MPSVYERRIEQEWRLLQSLATANRSVLEILDRQKEPNIDFFRITLRRNLGLVKQGSALDFLDTHVAVLYFPRFFPAVPIEASLARPVFHPNVHPENGFVCLWNRFSPGDTVIEAVAQLQRIITWQLKNEELDHLLQPDCLTWYRDPARAIEVPLSGQPLRSPPGFKMERTYAQIPGFNRRHRLS